MPSPGLMRRPPGAAGAGHPRRQRALRGRRGADLLRPDDLEAGDVGRGPRRGARAHEARAGRIRGARHPHHDSVLPLDSRGRGLPRRALRHDVPRPQARPRATGSRCDPDDEDTRCWRRWRWRCVSSRRRRVPAADRRPRPSAAGSRRPGTARCAAGQSGEGIHACSSNSRSAGASGRAACRPATIGWYHVAWTIGCSRWIPRAVGRQTLSLLVREGDGAVNERGGTVVARRAAPRFDVSIDGQALPARAGLALRPACRRVGRCRAGPAAGDRADAGQGGPGAGRAR